MAKAIFSTVFPAETSLPSMEADNGYQLHYTDGGVLCGGFSLVGLNPLAPNCLAWVWASDVVIAQMRADPRYLWVSDVNPDEI